MMINLLTAILVLVLATQILWFQIKTLQELKRINALKESDEIQKRVGIDVSSSMWEPSTQEVSLTFYPLPTKVEWDILTRLFEGNEHIKVSPYNRFDLKYRFEIDKVISIESIVDVLTKELNPQGWTVYVCDRTPF